MSKNTGGPAYPVIIGTYTGDDGEHHNDVVRGMTLRDYFAGQALAGMCASETEGAVYAVEAAAERAYRFADAMIKAREAEGEKA